jgi:hypothetical protein
MATYDMRSCLSSNETKVRDYTYPSTELTKNGESIPMSQQNMLSTHSRLCTEENQDIRSLFIK